MATIRKPRPPREIEEEEPEVDVSTTLKLDEKFKRYLRIVKVIRESMDFEKIWAEVQRLHAGRSSRNLYGSMPTVEKMTKAALQDGAVRARLAEIRVEMSGQLSSLREANLAIKKHILHEFRSHTAGLRTKGERMSFAERHIERGISLESKFEDMIARCDFLIKDVDQMNYSLKTTMTAMTIFYSHKNDSKGV